MKNGSPLLKMVKDGLDRLADELAQGHTEAFLDYLKAMGRFHRYSSRNTMLIWMQKPEATLVAGIRTWNEMGRYVRKGEKGIRILAPVIQLVEETDEQGQKVRVPNVVGFRTTYVFDVSQTEGKPLPSPPVAQGPEEVYHLLLRACPLRVEETLLRNGRHGETNGQWIRLEAGLPKAEKAATLLHEWAHALLHFRSSPTDPVLPRELREMEAEAVAYVVGTRLGLEMQASRDYILTWAGQATEHLETHLDRIASAVATILGRFEDEGGLTAPRGGVKEVNHEGTHERTLCPEPHPYT